jgi:hypothetical protein
MSDTKITAFLRKHPKMMGVLFTLLVLLSQAGSAAAARGITVT